MSHKNIVIDNDITLVLNTEKKTQEGKCLYYIVDKITGTLSKSLNLPEEKSKKRKKDEPEHTEVQTPRETDKV